MAIQNLTYDQLVFWDSEGIRKFLDGVIRTQALKISTQNFLQSNLGDVNTTLSDTVNFDIEKARKNIMGHYAAPKADVRGIELPTFGHKEFRFTYSKEFIGDSEYVEARQRRLGQLDIDVMANMAADLQEKTAIAMNCFTNLKELGIRDIIYKGTHTATSEYHPTMTWDFGRNTIIDGTTYLAALKSHTAYSVDFTNASFTDNGGATKRCWDVTGGTVAPTPYKDIISAAKAQKRKLGGRLGICIISEDALEYLERDLQANYAEASKTTTMVLANIEQKILPAAAKFEGLEFRRALPITDGSGSPTGYLNVYTYAAWYHERKTGVLKQLIPNGWFAILPPPEYGIIRYGKIMHRKAEFQAQQYFINTWENQKEGTRNSEIHSSWVLGYPDIDVVCAWKVLNVADGT
jgi:hypothetical protein